MPLTRTDVPALTGLRAFAAVWVVLLHLQFGVGIHGKLDLGPVAAHGFWAVDVFFVLSGFILSMIYAGPMRGDNGLRAYGPYLWARFARIYPLHLFTIALLAAWYLGRLILDGGYELPPGFSLSKLALNLTLLHGWGYADRLSWNYPSWSIGTEWFAYLLLLPLLARGLWRAPVAVVLAIGAVLWSTLVHIVHGFGDLVGHQASAWAPMRIGAEFTLGYGLWRLSCVAPPGPRMADLFMLSGVIGIAALCFAPGGSEVLLAPLVCVLIFGLAHAGPLGRRVFAHPLSVFWGERSYSLYMLHAVVQIYANLVVERLGLIDMSASVAWWWLLAQLGAVFVVSHLAYRTVEMPMRRKLRSLAERLPHLQKAGVPTPEALR